MRRGSDARRAARALRRRWQPPGAPRSGGIADLDGDGDQVFMAFGEKVDVCHALDDFPTWTSAEPLATDPAEPLIATNVTRTSGLTLPFMPHLADWPQARGARR